jgi:hypothetical protein
MVISDYIFYYFSMFIIPIFLHGIVLKDFLTAKHAKTTFAKASVVKKTQSTQS